MNENIHIHSVMSTFDGAGEPKAMVLAAKEMGAEFFALTDHGTMTGIFEAWDTCEKEGLSFIPGVEAYVESQEKRPYHFILLSKDMEGYHGISKACTYAERNIDHEGRPVMKKADMEALFGEGGRYHGHVIATTACIQGEAALCLLHNTYIQKECQKLAEKVKGLPKKDDPKFIQLRESKTNLEAVVQYLTQLKKDLKAVEKKPYKKRFRQTFVKMKSQGLSEDVINKAYETAVLPEGYTPDKDDKELFREMAESKEAPEQIRATEKELKAKTAELKKISETYDQLLTKVVKSDVVNDQIEERKKDLKTDDEMRADAEKAILYYAGIFGRENFYVEVQNHGMPEEADSYPVLAEIARKNGIRIVASNDVHMISKEDTHKRELIRAKRFNKYENASDADKELYMKSSDELKEILCRIMPADIVDEAIANISVIGKSCHLERKKEGYYPVFPLPEGVTADDEIRRICYENIEWRYPNREGWTEEHEKRLEYELGVICKMGFADYHLIEQDIVEVAHYLGRVPAEHLSEAPLEKEELKKWCEENDYTAGMGVGIGRGSAAGSIVCYLLGITGLDPLKYSLIFERFLNIERVSMPDIDTDFEPEVRTQLVKYVQRKYGEDYVCGIVTKGTQAAKGSIRNCARYLGDKMFGDGQHYRAIADSIASTIPSKPGTTLADCETMFAEKFANNPDAMQIIADAKLVEGSFDHYGIHPAGVIISDKDPIIEHMPLMWDDTAQMMKTQCNMIQAEKLGLLKMDFLVLGTLTVITRTLQKLKKKGVSVDLFKLDFEPAVLKNVYAEGNTTAVFQFESGGMRQMLRKFKPDCFEDLILLNAAYRPGPMDSLEEIISCKKTGEMRFSIPELEPILGTTYGSIIYQEQVMEIFQKLAGYSLGQADLVRRAMSKKHLDELLLEKEAFLHGDAARNIDGCEARGIDLNAADELFERMTAFASYAFNKSHAAVYSYVSYITAWLKEHFPAEYLAEAMTAAKQEKYPSLIAEAKRYGIKVSAPSINESEDGFSVVSDKEIRFGLGKVKDVKTATKEITKERINGRYTSVRNFFERTSVNIGAVNSLVKAGAFDSFADSRKALLESLETIKDGVADVKKAQAALEKVKKEGKDTTKAETNLQRTEIAMNNIIIPLSVVDDPDERIRNEHEVLGTFVTAHPIDNYEAGESAIDDLEPTFGRNDTKTAVGVVTDLKIVKTKKDGKDMAFFKLEDHSGVIDVVIFATSYAQYGELLEEGKVLAVTGNIETEYDEYDESEAKEIKKMKACEISNARKKRANVVVTIPSIDQWKSVNELLKQAYADDGDNVIIYDSELSEFRKFKKPRYVSEKVFALGLDVKKM